MILSQLEKNTKIATPENREIIISKLIAFFSVNNCLNQSLKSFAISISFALEGESGLTDFAVQVKKIVKINETNSALKTWEIINIEELP
ncbi:hypothetical protein KQ878_00310 [Mycoplasma zalophidermidis]|uniref:Uncharacterized protein n=1 Tax=Mycoplasma zalophidermidis TaxID=398174 RepID=A0ABS6DQP6_9MOLU|nr:hypothetical protein [Mycoplasma zalophidermidis]MBU4693328.1 hypothetical protein [Mycoplasma zalophidermidis]MCR8966374.1 hypothetical protein [Mycoplasma zalophidermidis]